MTRKLLSWLSRWLLKLSSLTESIRPKHDTKLLLSTYIQTTMSRMKTFKVTLTGGGPALQVEIEAINPPQARKFAEARYPGYRAGGANQVY